MQGPEREIPGITRVTVAPAPRTRQPAGQRHQNEPRREQPPRGEQDRHEHHARQRGQHPGDKPQQHVTTSRTTPIQRFRKRRRHAPRTTRGGITMKIRSRHSDFGYTRHLCSLQKLKAMRTIRSLATGNRPTLDVLHTPGFDVPDRDRVFLIWSVWAERVSAGIPPSHKQTLVRITISPPPLRDRARQLCPAQNRRKAHNGHGRTANRIAARESRH